MQPKDQGDLDLVAHHLLKWGCGYNSLLLGLLSPHPNLISVDYFGDSNLASTEILQQNNYMWDVYSSDQSSLGWCCNTSPMGNWGWVGPKMVFMDPSTWQVCCEFIINDPFHGGI